MRTGNTRRRCSAIVRDLEIPEPFDLGQFMAKLARQRQRAIILHPFTSRPGDPCGLWIRTAETDHIFHEQGTTPWHMTHIVTHEIAHVLLDHRGSTTWHDLIDLLAPDVDAALAGLILGRTAYSTQKEREAETLASLILERASAAPRTVPAVGTQTAAVISRLEQTWGLGNRRSQPCSYSN